MSSTPASKDTPNPLVALPTLQIIPSFTYTPAVIPTSGSAVVPTLASAAVPALAPLPAATEAHLAAIARSADGPRSAPVKRGVLPFDPEPFDSLDNEQLDPEEDAFFSGPPDSLPNRPPLTPLADKGKQKVSGVRAWRHWQPQGVPNRPKTAARFYRGGWFIEPICAQRARTPSPGCRHPSTSFDPKTVQPVLHACT
ncbi:hypothetical protein K438DRAFT_1783732 [Mycena galopus ATCC 62051]|nr:hypothetical protein K438DRAFT_1783732 [Mycena galopus ATCC 62051]